MTPEQKVLVQDSFAQVAPISEKTAESFYGRLFELDPAIRPLFEADMKEQGKKLMTILGVAVHSLNDLDALVPMLQNLEDSVLPAHKKDLAISG